jgi:alkylhydroperoxidase family enzyme
MLNVKHIPSDQATGRLKEFYDRMRTTIRGAIGRDFQGDQKLFLASSLQLEVMESWLAHRQICVEQLGIEPREYELILMRVMYLHKGRYVAANHGVILARLAGYTREQIFQYTRDWENSDLNPRAKALLHFTDKVALRSHEVTRADVEAVLAVGLTEAQVVALIFAIGWLVSNAIVPNALLGRELDDFSSEFHDLIEPA